VRIVKDLSKTSVKRIIPRPSFKKLCNIILRLINGLRIIRRKLNEKQSLTVVTAQVFSILYYASPVWLTPSIGREVMKDVESLHFKALRMITLDYKRRRSKEWLTNRTQRLSPNLWLRFAAAKLMMKIWSTGTPLRLRNEAFANTFTKSCKEGFLFGYDSSTYKVGKQETKNWCGSILSGIKVPWTSAVYDKDRVRVLLKASFYPYNFLVFNH